MKSRLLKITVIAVLGVSNHVFATGLVALPAAGFTVTAGTNQPAGTTGWVTCNATGNYGSGLYVQPNYMFNNTCAVFPGGGRNLTTSPVETIATAVTALVISNITVNSQTLGTLGQRTWRNAGSTECIFAKYINFSYTSGMAVNDIALGGFSTTAAVQAGYYYTGNNDSPVFRMGRSFTSVQMQSNAAGTAPAAGFVHRPINGPTIPAASTEINGVGQTASSTGTPPGPNPGSVVPTAAQQTSEIRTNWVDFTLDATGNTDLDGTTSPVSPVLYVQAACSGTTQNNANTIRIRQTGQETQPWVTILAAGQTRVGANANF